jgi:hypothetical protein
MTLDAQPGSLYVFLGNGNGSFQPGVSYVTPNNPLSVAVGDFNGDGKLDVAVGNGGSNSVSLLLGNGDGTFQAAVDFGASNQTAWVIAGDFNGDGMLDLQVPGTSNQGNDAVLLLLQGSFPVASPFPGNLTFGQQAIGTTSPQQVVTLTNTGAAALALATVNIIGPNAGSFAQTNNCGSALAPQGNCQISVTFTPTALVNATASLNITDNAPGSPQLVNLSGTTPPTPMVNVSPTSISFPNQYVGTSGLPQSVTITNTGTGVLTISSVSTSPADFGNLNACGSSIAVGSSCAIGVFFDPTASGARTGTLTITDDATGSPQTVALSGTGQDFALAVPVSTATVAAGQTASYTVAVSPGGGFNQSVSLSCTGAPALSACTVSPNPVILNGSTASSVTVTVTTTAPATVFPDPPSTRPHFPNNSHPLVLVLVLLALALAVSRGSQAKRPLAVRCLLVVTLCTGVGLVACGGGTSVPPKPGTTAGTYSLTVSGTFTSGSTTLAHNTKLTLVVQ